LEKLNTFRKHKLPWAVSAGAGLLLGTMVVRGAEEPAEADNLTTYQLPHRPAQETSRDMDRRSLAAVMAQAMVDRAAKSPMPVKPPAPKPKPETKSQPAHHEASKGINGYWFGQKDYYEGLRQKAQVHSEVMRNAKVLYQVGKAAGLSNTEIGDLDNIAYRESGLYTRAHNSSGAYGIPQAAPGDKMATMGPNWQTDPATQIKWMIHYVDKAYGGPAEAWDFWQAHNWY
jgi:hypothetical protein